jgi:hypothetical protein
MGIPNVLEDRYKSATPACSQNSDGGSGLSTLPLVTSLDVEALVYIRNPQNGTPYAVIKGIGPDLETYVCLVCAKVWDLDKVRLLKGLTVNVRPDCNGLKLKPLDLQPEETIRAVVDRLESGGTLCQAPEAVIQTEPKSNQFQPDDPDERAFCFFSRMLAAVADSASEKGIPVGAWIFMPQGRA